MSKYEKYDETSIATMIVVVPVTVLIVVAIFNYIKEKREKEIRSQEANNPTVNVECIPTVSIFPQGENLSANNSTQDSTPQPRQSDHQIIFGGLNTPAPSTENFHGHPLPQYSFQDDSLPTYKQAVRCDD